MSQNDKPKLDDLQKLLRRLERVEAEKAERSARLADAPVDAARPAAAKAEHGAGQVNGPPSTENKVAPQASSSGGPANGANGAETKKPEGPLFAITPGSSTDQPPQSQPGTLGPGNQSKIGDASRKKPGQPPAEATQAEGSSGNRFASDANDKPVAGQDKQHLARMVYRGAARDVAQAGLGSESNLPVDPAPFQLPALPDGYSRDVTGGEEEAARPGSSIGVVLVAAITAAVVSTVAAVLITVWVIRGGGLGGQSDPVVTASKTASKVSGGEVSGVTRTGANAARSTEPPAADPPPETEKPGASASSAPNAEAEGPAGNENSSGKPASESSEVGATSQEIAAAIASDQPSETPAGEQTRQTASGDVTTSAQSDEPIRAIDLAAITNTAPEPDRSEMVRPDEASKPAVSASVAHSDPQPAAQSDATAAAVGSSPAATGEERDKAASSETASPRSGALAFNDTSPGEKPAGSERATGSSSDAAPDAATGPAAPGPRPPYALVNPTRLATKPDVSFEFPLKIETSAGNLDNHFLIVSGLKRGVRLSQGIELMFDTWQVPANKLEQLKLTVPAGFARELPVMIELRRPDGMPVARSSLLLTASGSAERLDLPPELFESESQALPASVLAKVREAERAIDNGNLRGARLALQEAALQTSAVAAMMLAMSYDPRHAGKFGDAAAGNADAATARQWYGRASSFGAAMATSLSRGL